MASKAERIQLLSSRRLFDHGRNRFPSNSASVKCRTAQRGHLHTRTLEARINIWHLQPVLKRIWLCEHAAALCCAIKGRLHLHVKPLHPLCPLVRAFAPLNVNLVRLPLRVQRPLRGRAVRVGCRKARRYRCSHSTNLAPRTRAKAWVWACTASQPQKQPHGQSANLAKAWHIKWAVRR